MNSPQNINQERSTSHEYFNTRSKKKARDTERLVGSFFILVYKAFIL